VSGAGFKLWKYAKGSCLLAPVFWYVYGGWLLSCFITLFANAAMLNGFFVGLGLAFIKPLFGLFANVYERLAEFQRDRAYRRNYEQRTQEQTKPNFSHEREKQEQRKREREAEAQRTREQARREQPHQEEHTQQVPPSTPPDLDRRTPPEILGLAPDWTPDELEKAYRRECQRLHPDKWTGKPPAIREAMEQEFKRVQEAYKRLKGS
jgi:curved DNA-binding protein CbpA